MSALLDARGMPVRIGSRSYAALPFDWADPTGWSAALDGIGDGVRRLKAVEGGEFQIHGSETLAQALMRTGLIGLVRLWVHPVALGHGKRLFADDHSEAFRLTGCRPLPSGVIVLDYEPAGPVATGSFALAQ